MSDALAPLRTRLRELVTPGPVLGVEVLRALEAEGWSKRDIFRASGSVVRGGGLLTHPGGGGAPRRPPAPRRAPRAPRRRVLAPVGRCRHGFTVTLQDGAYKCALCEMQDQ